MINRYISKLLIYIYVNKYKILACEQCEFVFGLRVGWRGATETEHEINEGGHAWDCVSHLHDIYKIYSS